MTTRRDLHARSNQLLRAGHADEALAPLAALVQSAPHDFDARIRLADALLATGSTAAIDGYAHVAREALLAGYPLKALVALHVLGQLDPDVRAATTTLLASHYAAGAPGLGRGVRLATPDPDALVSAHEAPVSRDRAGGLLADRTGLAALPAVRPPVALLSELPPGAFERLLSAMDLVRLPAGATVVREGDPGDALYMLARGRVEVSRAVGDTVTTLASLGDGTVFGEMALVSGAPRTATVTVREDADLLVFGRDAVFAVAHESPAVAEALKRFTRERLLANLLATHPLFRPFDTTARHALAARFSAHEASAGTALLREKSPGRGLFLLLSGGAAVHATGADGVPVMVGTLGPGDVCGEIGLLDARDATATVTVTHDATVLLLAREVFARLVEASPEVRAYLETLADDRRIETSMALADAMDGGGEEVAVMF